MLQYLLLKILHFYLIFYCCLGWLRSRLVMLFASSFKIYFVLETKVLITGLLFDKVVSSNALYVFELKTVNDLSFVVVYSRSFVLRVFLEDLIRIPDLEIRCFYWYCLSNLIEWSLARDTPFFEPLRDFYLDFFSWCY